MVARIFELQASDYRLGITPERGGSIAYFTWRTHALMRATCGPSILDTACFPLVPFSNRIAFGRFEGPDGPVQLAPNFPGGGHPHALHGFGWLAEWAVVSATTDAITIRHDYESDAWPWPYRAEQTFVLSHAGLRHDLSARNLGSSAMPTGLGFHPYFLHNEATVYRGLHSGEWRTFDDGLPIALDRHDQPRDWWNGSPVGARVVDTVYEGRTGPLSIDWPDRNLKLIIQPSDPLSRTVVYVPAGQNFFASNRSVIQPMRSIAQAVRPDCAGSNRGEVLTPRYHMMRCATIDHSQTR